MLFDDSTWLTVLRVACTLAQPFTIEDLVVACWRRDGRRFGIEGHALPHSARVTSKIYGTHGLIGKGYLKGNHARLSVTQAGRERAEKHE